MMRDWIICIITLFQWFYWFLKCQLLMMGTQIHWAQSCCSSLKWIYFNIQFFRWFISFQCTLNTVTLTRYEINNVVNKHSPVTDCDQRQTLGIELLSEKQGIRSGAARGCCETKVTAVQVGPCLNGCHSAGHVWAEAFCSHHRTGQAQISSQLRDPNMWLLSENNFIKTFHSDFTNMWQLPNCSVMNHHSLINLTSVISQKHRGDTGDLWVTV